MKVKNIMFAGFAAAIFASFANAADAATYNLASKEYVDEQNKLDEKLTNKAATTTDLTDKDLDKMYPTVAKAAAMDTQVLTDAKAYTNTQNELDEKVANKAAGTEDFTNMSAEDKAAKYTSVAAAEKIAADAAQNATGTIDVTPVDAEDGKFFNKVGITDGTMTTEQKAFEEEISETTKDSKIAPQTKAVKTYVDAQNAAVTKYIDDQDALDEKVANKAAGTEDFTNMSAEDKAAKYTSVAAAEKIAADAAQNATGTIDVTPVNADDGKFFNQVGITDGAMTTAQTAFVEEINETTKDSKIAPQTAAVKTYVDNAIDEVNNGFDWLEGEANKQFIVQTDADGNETLVEIAIIGENGQPVYPVTTQGN